MLAGRRLEIPLGFEDEHVGQAWASLWQWPPEVLARQAGEVCSALGVVKAAQAPRSGIPHRMHHQELIPLVPYTQVPFCRWAPALPRDGKQLQQRADTTSSSCESRGGLPAENSLSLALQITAWL